MGEPEGRPVEHLILDSPKTCRSLSKLKSNLRPISLSQIVIVEDPNDHENNIQCKESVVLRRT